MGAWQAGRRGRGRRAAREETSSPELSQQLSRAPFLFSSIHGGIDPWNFTCLRGNRNCAILFPCHTSVAMTHSSRSSEMTYTDWYLVSLEVEWTDSGLFLSGSSPPRSVAGVPFSSPALP